VKNAGSFVCLILLFLYLGLLRGEAYSLAVEELSEYSQTQSQGQVPDSVEFAALKALFESTGGSNWTNKTNWLQGTTSADFAKWHGILVRNGDVVHIDLRNNNLRGSLPERLKDLSELQLLYLFQNQLEGHIGEWVANLKKLQQFILYNNNLTGNIPVGLGELTNLRRIFLYNNNLTGPIPPSLGKLQRLTHFYAYNNALQGSIPEELCNIKSLVALYLYNNQLIGDLPTHLGNLDKLTHLLLYNNQLEGPLPNSIGNMESLISLQLQNNKINDTIHSSIGNLKNLITLFLSNNQIIGSIPKSIGNLTSLTQIHLENNQLSGNIPDEITNLNSLVHLRLFQNNLTGSIPKEIGNMKSLERLFLYNNNLSGEIPSSIGDLDRLTHFLVFGNNLSGEIPSSIGNMEALEFFRVESNRIRGRVPETIGRLTKIRQFFLHNNMLEGAVPETVLSMVSLQDIRFHQNNFTSLPDFSQHPNRINLTVHASVNRIDFGYFEPMFTSPGNHVLNILTHHNQASDFESQTVTYIPGSEVKFAFESKGAHNTFQWFRRVNGNWSAIAGATNREYVITNALEVHEGEYRCHVLNSWLPGSTLLYHFTLEKGAPLELFVDTRSLGRQYKYQVRINDQSSIYSTGAVETIKLPFSSTRVELELSPVNGEQKSKLEVMLDQSSSISLLHYLKGSEAIPLPGKYYSVRGGNELVLYDFIGSSGHVQWPMDIVLDRGILMTPNSDGFYDVFRVEGVEEVEVFSLIIYDQHNGEVYSSQDKSAYWEGIDQRNNAKVVPGVYKYSVRADEMEVEGQFLVDY
jgi:gliding motility-associated-like protein